MAQVGRVLGKAMASALGQRGLGVAALAGLLLGLARAVVLEPVIVTSGSMAPALRGPHRACLCPACGQGLAVGRAPGDRLGQGDARYYAKAECPNCGCDRLPLGEAPEAAGDRLLVNKAAYWLQPPRRWDLVLLRLFDAEYLKRLLGLPGETLELRAGDVYIDGALLRKPWPLVRELRVPVYDLRFAVPGREGERWRTEGEVDVRRGGMRLNAVDAPAVAAYCHGDACGHEIALNDELPYNAGTHAHAEPVHDFSCQLEVRLRAGAGELRAMLYDGAEEVPAVVPGGALADGAWHRIEAALVDRRHTVLLDGVKLHELDLPEASLRQAVARPVRLEARGLDLEVRDFVLYRDVHYSQRGEHGRAGRPVQLGMDQYFVLGDNSINSEDSRFWSDRGRVHRLQLLGRPLRCTFAASDER